MQQIWFSWMILYCQNPKCKIMNLTWELLKPYSVIVVTNFDYHTWELWHSSQFWNFLWNVDVSFLHSSRRVQNELWIHFFNDDLIFGPQPSNQKVSKSSQSRNSFKQLPVFRFYLSKWRSRSSWQLRSNLFGDRSTGQVMLRSFAQWLPRQDLFGKASGNGSFRRCMRNRKRWRCHRSGS